MNNFPVKKEEFEQWAGKFADSSPELFHSINTETIAVGGDPSERREGSIDFNCYICGAITLMDVRDIPMLEGVDHVILCPTCYLKGVE